jgi:hypothetical protein
MVGYYLSGEGDGKFVALRFSNLQQPVQTFGFIIFILFNSMNFRYFSGKFFIWRKRNFNNITVSFTFFPIFVFLPPNK